VSGHYYFKDFYNADFGHRPALLILERLSRRTRSCPSCWSAALQVLHLGRDQLRSEDPDAKMAEIEERFSDGEVTKLDGISVDYEDWHFNVRKSNTEPLLRLCLESQVSVEDMEAKRDRVLGLIRS
jgi:phosphomannomutase